MEVELGENVFEIYRTASEVLPTPFDESLKNYSEMCLLITTLTTQYDNFCL